MKENERKQSEKWKKIKRKLKKIECISEWSLFHGDLGEPSERLPFFPRRRANFFRMYSLRNKGSRPEEHPANDLRGDRDGTESGEER